MLTAIASIYPLARFLAIALLVNLAALGCSQIAQPPGVKNLNATQSDLSRRHADNLKLFEEQDILSSASSRHEVYRLIVWPTFTSPLLFRVEERGAKYFIVSKVLSGQGGYDYGHLQVVRERVITPEQWRRLKSLLQESSFWQLPTEDARFEPDSEGNSMICLDGSTWLLEGLRNGEYHAVERYCPELPKLEACGHFLLELSQLEIDQRDL